MTAPASPRVLLVGPYPPPYGGISVHVARLERLLLERGIDARVLDSGGHRDGPAGGSRSAARVALLARLREPSRRGWIVHVHTNGHNRGSWLLVLSAGLTAAAAPARLLTLHSGMLPDHLASGERGARALARLALRPYDRILCVSERLRATIASLGVEPERLVVAPAYLPAPLRPVALPEATSTWLGRHWPVLSTALFYRPEYGFEVLLDAMTVLRRRYPALGCLVLGDGAGVALGEAEARARGLAGALHLGGDVSHDLCLNLIARSDLFVRPARTDGDASSVREALQLGVPVVASDAAARPSGAVLFPSGDAAALAQRIDGVLCCAQKPITADGGAEGARAIDGLLDVYRRASPADEEGACAPQSWAS
jgi:glycosyltransferase involved in cell wall biosynthesis